MAASSPLLLESCARAATASQLDAASAAPPRYALLSPLALAARALRPGDGALVLAGARPLFAGRVWPSGSGGSGGTPA
jgi:hypothetical protein